MDEANSVPAIRGRLGQLVVGLYGWLYAAYFGLVVLDGVYARMLRNDLDPTVTERIFTEISDFLLLPFAVLLLLGAVAFITVARYRGPRNLILISWLLPVISIPLYLVLGPSLEASGLGPGVRLLMSGLGSALVMVAVLQFSRSERKD